MLLFGLDMIDHSYGCRLVTVRSTDTFIVMDQGKMAEQSSHEQLVAAGGIYAALVERQSGGVDQRERDMAPTIPATVRMLPASHIVDAHLPTCACQHGSPVAFSCTPDVGTSICC